MKTIKLMLAALVALGMFSCKNDDNQLDQGTKQMVVKIANMQQETRAEAGPVTDGYVTELSSAYVFVIKADGAVVTRYQFTAADLAAGSAAFEASTAASEVIVVGNYPAAFNPLSYTSKTEIEAAVVNMADLVPASSNVVADANYHGVKNAMLYNDTAATVNNTGTAMSASLSIFPVMARIQVAKIEGLTVDVDGQGNPIKPLKSYTLNGIYLNRVHTALTLPIPALAPAGDFMENDTTHPLASRPSWSYNAYTTEFTGGLVYELPDGTGEPAVAYDRVWAYHIAPVNGTVPGSSPAKANVPNIAVHISGVIVLDGGVDEAVTGDRYIVVTGYKDSVTGQAIEKFERGNVYTVENISFRSDQIREEYYDEMLTLTVTVTVKPWVLHIVEPII